MDTASKGNKQTHRQGLETNSEGSTFCWGFFKINKKLEACPYKNTTNPTARCKLFSQNDYYNCWKVKEATSLEGSTNPCRYTPHPKPPCLHVLCVMTEDILPLRVWPITDYVSHCSHTWMCTLQLVHTQFGFWRVFFWHQKAINHLLQYCHPGDLSLDFQMNITGAD